MRAFSTFDGNWLATQLESTNLLLTFYKVSVQCDILQGVWQLGISASLFRLALSANLHIYLQHFILNTVNQYDYMFWISAYSTIHWYSQVTSLFDLKQSFLETVTQADSCITAGERGGNKLKKKSRKAAEEYPVVGCVRPQGKWSATSTLRVLLINVAVNYIPMHNSGQHEVSWYKI